MKAVNAFIFAGSFSIGVMKAGFDLEKVLEISDAILEQNAFYWKKNYPEIPVILPSEWENNQYLDTLKNENVDIMCCNCPCSSLSTINRNASVDGKNNVHFYRLFNIFKKAQPKTFVIENAPTLIKLGFPILKDLAKELHNQYFITILHDKAGNHEVPMQRMRTMVVGWRKDVFKEHPIVNLDVHEKIDAQAALADIISDTTNDHPSPGYDDISSIYKYAVKGQPLMMGLGRHYIGEYPDDDPKVKEEIEKVINSSKHKNEFKTIVEKLKIKKNIWDKSPFKPKEGQYFPSFSSVQEYMHPTQDRTLNINELKRLMGYPANFDFTDPNGECKIPVCQAMAQGVPVNFGKYIASQVKLGLEGSLETHGTDEIIYQDNLKKKASSFTLDEFMSLDGLDIKSDSFGLK